MHNSRKSYSFSLKNACFLKKIVFLYFTLPPQPNPVFHKEAKRGPVLRNSSHLMYNTWSVGSCTSLVNTMKTSLPIFPIHNIFSIKFFCEQDFLLSRKYFHPWISSMQVSLRRTGDNENTADAKLCSKDSIQRGNEGGGYGNRARCFRLYEWDGSFIRNWEDTWKWHDDMGMPWWYGILNYITWCKRFDLAHS